MIDWAQLQTQATDLATQYAPRLAAALLVLVLGWIAIGFVRRGLRKGFEKREFDKSLTSFLTSVASIGLKVLLLISVASMLGIQMTSFIAVLGAAGLAVGLALQGSLSNFAGGVLILASKPFKVDEVIQAQGHTGTVQSIKILYTTLKTFTGETVVIPNGDLANSDIKNYTRSPTRRLDLTVGIGYDDDIKHAKQVLQAIVDDEERIHADPEPKIDVSELGGSSVDIKLRLWTSNEDYWPLKYALTERIKLTFDQEGISFPYPSSDVYLHKN